MTDKVKTTMPPVLSLNIIRRRDTRCVYCGRIMLLKWDANNRDESPTIEHLNHRMDWDSIGSYIRDGKDVAEIAAICCGRCNSSRSDKSLREWFKSNYCLERNIGQATVARVVQNYLEKFEPL